MLADQLDYVVGVDPHRDSHALAVVDVRNGAVVFEANVAANSAGYRRALVLGEEHAPGRRVFAVEGQARSVPVSRASSQVVASGRSRSAGCGERRSGGKTDALDAVRAARSVLASERQATPRAGGERQALQALGACAFFCVSVGG
jgi:transposase